MTLITIRRRTPRRPSAAAYARNRTIWPAALLAVLAGASAVGAQLVWLRAGGGLPPARCARRAARHRVRWRSCRSSASAAPIALFLALRFARVTDPRLWVPAWTLGAPWLLLTLTWIAPLSALAVVWLVPIPWVWFGWWPLGSRRPAPLHRARWASRGDLRAVLTRPSRGPQSRPAGLPPAEAVILGTLGNDWVSVRTLPTHRELGGVLVVGRPRSGKGLLAITQLLGAWEQRSVVVTDLKGEAHAATAG